MAKTKRIFISDLHLSSEDLYTAKVAWPTKPQRERLNQFLRDHVLAKAASIKDFVLLGDVFDTWVCPYDVVPPTYEAIFDANAEFIALINAIQKAGVQVFYVVGNHDSPAPTSPQLERLPGVKMLETKPYRSGLSLAEHGNRYDVFNAKDWNSDPTFGRPIGYFISRLAASRGALPTAEDIWQLLRDIVTARTDYSQLVDVIIGAVALRAGLTDADKIKMPEGLPEISIGEVKQRYAGFQSEVSAAALMKKLWETLDLDKAADRLCRDDGYNLVVFGHSHHAALDKDWLLTHDFLYANCGCWRRDVAHCVQVDKNPRKPGVEVTLFEVDMACNVQVEHQASV